MNKRIVIIGGIVLLLGVVAVSLFLLLPARGAGEIVEEVDKTDTVRINTLRLAGEYGDQGEYQRALDLLDNLLVQNPDDEEARELRDSIIEAKNRAEREKTERDQAREDKISETLNQLGENLGESQRQSTVRESTEEEERREAERLAAMDEAARERAERVKSSIEKGIAAMKEDDHDKAREHFNEAVEIDPDSGEAYARLGESYYLEDSEDPENTQKAIVNSNKAIEKDPNQ
ncbi:MAG: tetratricopeptide repeat protein, partial [Spirochaetota bacterium]